MIRYDKRTPEIDETNLVRNYADCCTLLYPPPAALSSNCWYPKEAEKLSASNGIFTSP